MLRVLTALVALLLPGFSWACEAWTDSDANNTTLKVGSVQITVNDVFNNNIDAENQFIHRLANQLHIQSKKELIEAQLLFSQGELFDPELLLETARNLRANRYLRSATVTPIQICEGEVDILVETGDNWTLIPGFNFERAGGKNTYSFSVSELNLLGLGKSLEIGVDYGAVRDQQVLQYFDPMLFGTSTQFTAQLQNNTDGEVQVIQFSKPFTSLDAKDSWGIRIGNTEFINTLHNNGLAVNQVSVDREFASIQKGFSTGRKAVKHRADGQTVFRVVRYSYGWQFDRLELASTVNFPDNQFTPVRQFSYPFVEVEFLQPEFIEQSNLQLMEAVEDVNVGHRLNARIGYAADYFGTTFAAFVTDIEYEKGWKQGERFLSLFNANISGYYSDDGIEDGLASATLKNFYFLSRKSQLFASANFTASEKLFANRQIVLGGATGLRGYPLNFQTGSRRTRLSFEHRYFFDWYPLRLARIGTATFADIGSAWEKNDDPSWLRDVGFGLRVVSTRQADAKVLHIDFAFPLDETDRIEQFQLVVTAKTLF